jgi:cellulose 1,4-beta-cellobiosidase
VKGALYFVQMDADGGMAKYPDNKAGPKYGTGYCDAQCPTDLKFISGMPNNDSWKPQKNDKNSGNGKYGSCCSEMDSWEANSMATAYVPHVCDKLEKTRCTGTACGRTGGGERFPARAAATAATSTRGACVTRRSGDRALHRRDRGPGLSPKEDRILG